MLIHGKKNSFLALLLFIYFLFSLFYSFINIVNSVTSENSLLLEKYINTINVNNNIKIDFLEIKKDIVNKFETEINITKNNLTFTGTMTPEFKEQIFYKMINNLSNELAEANTMIYFYYNSKNLESYIKQYFVNFGDYNFNKYIADIAKIKIQH